MKFQRILEAVHFKPWLITPTAHASIKQLLDTRLNESIKQDPSRVRLERPSEDFFGNDLPVMTVENGLATIPIHGVVGNRLGTIEKSCGAVGVEDISNDLQSALVDPSVKAILLDINSPGGTVTGVPELANEIAFAATKKPIYGFTDGQMASAAYWIGSSARWLYASQSADIGSIGVYLPWIDQSAAYAMEGLKVDLIKNSGGTYKGAGFPGTSLTEDQRDQLQDSVDHIFLMFAEHVMSNRKINEEALRGQTFMGDHAAAMNLIDGVKTRSEVLEIIRSKVLKS
jgi:signal peptide peptidase SppA